MEINFHIRIVIIISQHYRIIMNFLENNNYMEENQWKRRFSFFML